MNKYEIAVRLHRGTASGWAVDYALGGNPITGVLYAAEHSLESAEKAAAQWRKDVDVIRAVMREIEAEKQPAEPVAPCANPAGCIGERAHTNYENGHDRAVCDGLHRKCHPYQAPYNCPRYASGEQPMVGDIVCSDFGGERSYYAFLRPGRYHRIDARFVRELHLNDDLLHLVRRAEVAR